MDVSTQPKGSVRRQIDTVLKDTTDNQFNWSPPGTITPISSILIHILMGEDYFIQTILQGKLSCWETQEWGLKIGVQTPPEQSRSWGEFKTVKIMLALVLTYERVIRAVTDTYLSDLIVEELDRRVNFAGNELPLAEVLMTLAVHSASHAGELAAIKGMQGLKGLPF